MDIISRQEAITRGLKKYFTGLPCKAGHISEAYAHHGCAECISIRDKKMKAERRLKKKQEKEAANLINAASIQAELIRKATERVERKRRKNALYREHNRESINAAVRAWREENREKAKALVLAWHKKNPEARRVHKLNRRKQIKNGGRLSKNIVEKLMRLQRGKCACCGLIIGNDYHVDHIMPLALGGSNTDDNVQLLRSTCNLEKRAKHPVDFMQSRGFLL